MAEMIFSAAALGICAFTLQLLALKLARSRDVLNYVAPLGVALLAMTVILTGPIIFTSLPDLKYLYIALLPIVFFALTPSLYLYTRALTATQPEYLGWWHLKHYWALCIAVPLTILIATLPVSEQHALFFTETTELKGQLLLTAITFLVATLLWLVMSFFHLIAIINKLRCYRKQLKRVFSNNAGKQLYWLDTLTITLVMSWGYAVLVFLSDEHLASPWLNEASVLFLALLLVWLLCSFALNQQPGFAKVISEQSGASQLDAVVDDSLTETASKYQRSALGEAQAKRIASKVRHAVYEEKLYLDSALTLFKLAEHIGVSAQYLSQTLNQTLQQSFYDYINEARVAAAKQLLQQTNDSVLTIAMAVGFNARSSFYKAFKASTGLTPAHFRAQH